jgi:hypothetical protein
MRTEGAAASIPKTGELVAFAWRGGDLGAYLLYADGRLIWLDDVPGTPGWVEQRLTPEGVERIRSEFLSTGLFGPGKGPFGQEPREVTGPPPTCSPAWASLCVRDDGRLLARGVGGMSPEEQLLVDHLGTLPSSLPPTDWADQQIKAYVPSKYAVCVGAALPRGPFTAPPDPSNALKALPARAAKLLRRRRSDFSGGSACFEVTIGKARVLANELVNAFGAPGGAGGPTKEKYQFEIEADVNRPHVKRIAIQFWQLLPDGEIAFYYPAVA